MLNVYFTHGLIFITFPNAYHFFKYILEKFIFFFVFLFHTCRRQETNISSPEGLFMSDSAVYYLNKINL
jgi:hypothetical protein